MVSCLFVYKCLNSSNNIETGVHFKRGNKDKTRSVNERVGGDVGNGAK